MPFKLDKTGDLWFSNSNAKQTVSCFLCGEIFSALFPREINNEFICCSCQNMTKDEIIYLWIDDKKELNKLLNKLREESKLCQKKEETKPLNE